MNNSEHIHALPAPEVTKTSSEGNNTGKVEKKSGKRIGFNYIILKSIKESAKNDVIKCFYIKSLLNVGLCVIKEGSAGDVKDNDGRDIKDRLLWQKQIHEELQGKVNLPRLLGSFEENGNYYLVLEFIKGKSLYAICQKHKQHIRYALQVGNKLGMTFLSHLSKILSIIETLHQHHYVHRDITVNNFIISASGKVSIIDMELSYSLAKKEPSPPFVLGTFGYMSPEQRATKTPTIKEDIFSYGAILLYVWTGISPIKLTDAPINIIAEKVNFLVPDKIFADTIINCLHPNPLIRPSLKEIDGMLIQYKIDLKQQKKRPINKVSYAFQKDEIVKTIQQVIETLSTPLLADKEQGWFTDDFEATERKNKNIINKTWYTSFSRGATGVIYALSKANQLGFDLSACKPFINKGFDLILNKYISNIENTRPGLYFGTSGIAVSIAKAIQGGLTTEEPRYMEWIFKLLNKNNQALDIMNGLAGQGMATLICEKILGLNKLKQNLDNYTDYLLNVQQSDGSWVRELPDKTLRKTRGFANGVAGIVYYLLEYGSRYQSQEALEGSQRGLEWLIKTAVRSGDSANWKSSKGEEIIPWWWDGAPGIALSFLKGLSIFRDARYGNYAEMALRIHNKQCIDNNISQAYGLSGLGEIYLEAWRILGNPEWLERSEWIVQVIMHLKKNHSEYGPFWLVQGEKQAVADFMSGNSGVLHFLLGSCYTGRMNFPLSV